MKLITLWLVLPAIAFAQVPVRARQAIAAGNFEKALKLLDHEVATGGGAAELADLHLQRAACFHALGQGTEAELAAVAVLESRADATFPVHQASPALLELLEQARKRVLASVVVSTDRPASVRIDGTGWGPAPVTLELEVGRHVFEVQGRDGATGVREVLIEFGRENRVEIAPSALEVAPATLPLARVVEPLRAPPSPPLEAAQRARPSYAVPVGLLLSGLVVAGGGVAAFGWAQSHKTQVEAGLATRREAEQVLGANAAGLGALALGVGLIVTSVVLFMVTGRELHP